jgi:hypothetical protein
MSGDEREVAKQRERQARDLEDVAEVDGELAGRPDLAAAARAVARELRDEGDYMRKKGEGKDARSRR